MPFCVLMGKSSLLLSRSSTFPLPWGFVRADRLALWSIRRMGWFELGFDNSYFLRTLLRFGWSPHRHTNGVSHYTDVIAARKSHGYTTTWPA